MSGRVVLVTAVGEAAGAKAAAAALVSGASEPDLPGLLIEIGGRAPRPTLVASAGARRLEERLAVHLPQLRAASRGQTCHLAVPDDKTSFDAVRAALPLVRDSVAVLHLPPGRWTEALDATGIDVDAALLRADLDSDRDLTALAVRTLAERGLTVRVLKRPLGWVPSRRALFGVLPADAPGALPGRMFAALLEKQNPVEHACYGERDDPETDAAGAAQQQRRGDAGAGRGRGFRRDPERQASR
jgi:hypothetical protein